MTTNYALDIAAGLPEVIASQVTTTSEGNVYLHLPGVIVAESSTGETRYLLSDGLGSVRQAVNDSGAVVAYHEFDPYGNPIVNRQSEIENPYGFTGEWWEDEVGLLHLRARWYSPGTGTFLSVDPVESEPPYQYVRGNPTTWVDPSGMQPPVCQDNSTQICYNSPIGVPDMSEITLPSTAVPLPPSRFLVYDGEIGPLRRQLDESIKSGWFIHRNLLSNNRFQYGLLTFGDYALRVDTPKTTAKLLDGTSIIVPNTAFRTVYYIQGYLNMASFADGIYITDRAYAFNRANAGPANTRMRLGTISEMAHLQVTTSGYASYTGPGSTISPIRPGALPRTRFMGEEGGGILPYPPNVAFNRTVGIGLGRYSNYLKTLGTVSPGLRRYQVLIQKNMVPDQCHSLGGRWRALIQTYSLLFVHHKSQPIIRQNHLIKEPNGITKEIPF